MADSRLSVGAGVALVFASFLAASSALAEPPLAPPEPAPVPHHQVRWDPKWTHANAWDYSIAAVTTTASVIELTVLQPIRPTLRWKDPILFDTDVRNALMTSNLSTRASLEDTAWVLWGLQLAYPVLVDVPFAWARHGRQLAWDLFWQDAVTLTLAGAVDGAIRDIAGRARPDIYDCLQQGGAHCLDSPESTRSFPGGHFANSTAASVLTCTQHLYLRLYGGPWDGLTCALTLASNLTIGVFRIVSDNHWVSDQIVGGALGGLIGWLVPFAMHLHGHTQVVSDDGRPTALVLPMPIVLDRGGGMGLTGIF